ncbi:hypothetical protein PAXRUDRAFT_832809 [Paxillus rubicundulus Ve08.2h10]|uniref:Uncharacterized protein n=1 Tax=Paxillus rubicundulus Ve08.2h10 TaxID=930991 RepID=A0A0D0DQB3_9AGAM|nr:hypothetical protein PAXRUDRAFT_832809 [Paxillus rubicundulus Ve08.2h10]
MGKKDDREALSINYGGQYARLSKGYWFVKMGSTYAPTASAMGAPLLTGTRKIDSADGTGLGDH